MSFAGGLFLAFEGVEGSGKSTQVGLLADYLRAHEIPVIVAREPGSTPLGEQVRSLVLERPDLEIPPASELFLMLSARAAFIEQVVRPALQAGKVVLADRFELSTLAYQGAGRGIPVEDILRCNAVATGGLSPSATLLLELSPEEGARRQQAAAKQRDRMEQEELEFHRRVGRGYSQLAEAVSNIVRVDAHGSVPDVHRRIVGALAARFPETFPADGVIT